MHFHQRRLPHWQPENADYFVTWRLAGSPSPGRKLLFRESDAAMDRVDSGPRWLLDHRVAQIVQDALIYGAEVRQDYDLDAWAIMPNHVHVVFTPKRPLAEVLCWLKFTTARRANRILGRHGEPFWHEESYDHWIRSEREWRNTVAYVERNPEAAGLQNWPFTSASRCAGDEERSPALRPRH